MGESPVSPAANTPADPESSAAARMATDPTTLRRVLPVAPPADDRAVVYHSASTAPPGGSSLTQPAGAVLRNGGYRDGAQVGHDAVMDPALLDDQVTIISSRGPMPDFGTSRLAPLEVGKMLEGERLGQFVLNKFVGGGGMGAVFRAIDTTLNREVAVKVLSRFQSDEEETLRRFRNEAQSAARLDHDNIARVYYVGFDRGLHYIVFEFIEGENVRDLVERKGPLSVAEALSYTLQISEALSHASQRDVIHRDIKPSNVLVTPDGKAKLVDMGLARLHQVDQPQQDITASGVTLGTFDYISPEQARDPRTADVRSDLYSLGCSLFFMLTGQPPFPHGTVLQKLLQHQGDEPPDVRAVRPDLPVEIVAVLNRLLAKNPSDRFQQPSELILELLTIGRQVGMPAPTSVNVDWTLNAPRPAPWWEKHLPWVVPLTLLVVIVLALDYFTADANSNVFETQPNAFDSFGGDTRGRDAIAPADVRQLAPTKPPKTTAERASSAQRRSLDAIQSSEPAAASDQALTASGANRASSPNAVSAKPSLGGEGARSTGGVAESNAKTAEKAVASAATPRASTAEAVAPNSLTPAPTPVDPELLSPESPMPMPGATKPAWADSEESPSATRAGLLVVGDPDDRAPSFTTLRAACAAARNGDVIELRYNGIRDEQPIALNNTRLTIRAGDQYLPTVRFQPQEVEADLLARAMLSVSGGQLSVINVRFEFDVPTANLADNWAFCVAERAETLRFEQSTITIRNAGVGQAAFCAGAAFFRIQAPSGPSSTIPQAPGVTTTTNLPTIAAKRPHVDLQLQHCVARGEATFLLVADSEAVWASWHDGFLATSERLLLVQGTNESRQSGGVEVELQHLTAITRGGLALIDVNEPGPAGGPPVRIVCGDSILALPAKSFSPLIEQKVKAVGRSDEFRGGLAWKGDRNFYQGFEVFWQITSLSESLEMTYADWEEAWGESREYRCRRGAAKWQATSMSSDPFDRQSPADYALLPDAAKNPAIGAASDARDAGFLTDSLPPVERGLARD